jgi:hypothetical protein
LHSQEPDIVEVVPLVQVFGRDAELVTSQTLFTVVSVPKESGNVFISTMLLAKKKNLEMPEGSFFA